MQLCIVNRGRFDLSQQQGRLPRFSGFTLAELLVAIAIVSVIFLLQPSINSARRAAARISVMNQLKELGLTMINYRFARHHFPESEHELWDYIVRSSSDPDHHFMWHEVRICSSGLSYCYELESVSDSEFALCAVPQPPYDDYEFLICLTGRITDNGEVEFAYEELENDPAAVRAWEERRRAATVAGLDAVASMLEVSGDIESPSQVINGALALQNAILAGIDRNDDAVLEQVEIERILAPDPADSPLIAFARSTAREQYVAMSLDKDTYEGIPLVDLTGRGELFTARNIGLYIEANVDNPGVVRSLQLKADQMEELRFRLGDEAAFEPCTGLARAFRSEVEGQISQSISPQSATRLQILIGVLCPEPPRTDDAGSSP
jgi:prepilin-type N-terminal cleavage/methylation domain-containing protein